MTLSKFSQFEKIEKIKNGIFEQSAVSLLSNFERFYVERNVSSKDFEQTFKGRVDVQLKKFSSTEFSLAFREGLMAFIISASAVFFLRVLFLQLLFSIVKSPFTTGYSQKNVLLYKSVHLCHYDPQLFQLYICQCPQHNTQCTCRQHKPLCVCVRACVRACVCVCMCACACVCL